MSNIIDFFKGFMGIGKPKTPLDDNKPKTIIPPGYNRVSISRPSYKEIITTNYYNNLSAPVPMELFRILREQNEWVNHAVNTLSIACASCTPLVRVESKNDTDQAIVDLIGEKLTNEPNPNMEGYTLFVETYQDLILFGNSYWQVIPDRFGDICHFYRISPNYIRIIPDYDEYNNLTFYYIQLYPQVRVFGMNEIIHFKTPNSKSQLYGLPDFYSLMKTCSMDTNITELLSNFFETSFSGGFIFKQDADEEVAARNREWLADEFTGPQNAGRPMILEGSVELVSDGNKFQEFDFHALKDVGRDAILMAAGVPLSMAGVRAAHGQANQEVVQTEEAVFLRRVSNLQRIVFDKLNHDLIRKMMKKRKITLKPGINSKISMKNVIETMNASMRVGVQLSTIYESFGLPSPAFGADEWVSVTNNGLIPTKNLVGFDPNTGEEVQIIAVSDTNTVDTPSTKVGDYKIDPKKKATNE